MEVTHPGLHLLQNKYARVNHAHGYTCYSKYVSCVAEVCFVSLHAVS